MLKVKKVAFFGTLLFLSVLVAPVLSQTKDLTAKVNIVTPTGPSLRLKYWAEDSTIETNRAVDFSTGATGEASNGLTSWDDTDKGDQGDNFTSRDANVGFNIVAVSQQNAKVIIQCGKMTDEAGHEIPYQSPVPPLSPERTNFFGFSAVPIPEGDAGGYLVGSEVSMQPHSLAGTEIYTINVGDSYGKEIAVYNMLNVPANINIGPGERKEYKTTGSGDYADLLISLI